MSYLVSMRMKAFWKTTKKNLIMVLIQYFLFFCKLKTISKEIDTNMEETDGCQNDQHGGKFYSIPASPEAYVQMPSVSHGHSNAPLLSTLSAHTHLRKLILNRRSALTTQYECIQYRQYVWRKKWDPFRVTAGWVMTAVYRELFQDTSMRNVAET